MLGPDSAQAGKRQSVSIKTPWIYSTMQEEALKVLRKASK
jgi:hypothetical protein